MTNVVLVLQIFMHKSAMQMHNRDTHRSEVKPHQCQQCLKAFSSNHQLVQHIRVHTGEKPYKCSYCDRRFKQLSHVQQHTRLHTGEYPHTSSFLPGASLGTFFCCPFLWWLLGRGLLNRGMPSCIMSIFRPLALLQSLKQYSYREIIGFLEYLEGVYSPSVRLLIYNTATTL